MPVFDQGYQHWQGRLSGHAWRWLTITRHGVRALSRNRLPRIVLSLSLIPAVALAAVLVLWGLFEQGSELVKPVFALLPLPEEIKAGPREFRVPVWALAYHYFFQVQMFLAMILVVLIGPGLVSQDLRLNALPLYFSRPLRRVDYFAGKLGVIAFFLGGVIVVPAVVAYVLGVCFSLDLGVVRDTARLLAASVGYGLVVVLSAGTLMLALSSLSRSSRYVAAMWVGLWLISATVSTVLTVIHIESVQHQVLAERAGRERPGPRPADPEGRAEWERKQLEYGRARRQARDEADAAVAGATRDSWRPLLSYVANLQRLGDALLDTESAARRLVGAVVPKGPDRDAAIDRMAAPLAGLRHPWYWSAGVLAVLFGLSLCTLTFRVRSLDRLR